MELLKPNSMLAHKVIAYNHLQQHNTNNLTKATALNFSKRKLTEGKNTEYQKQNIEVIFDYIKNNFDNFNANPFIAYSYEQISKRIK